MMTANTLIFTFPVVLLHSVELLDRRITFRVSFRRGVWDLFREHACMYRRQENTRRWSALESCGTAKCRPCP